MALGPLSRARTHRREAQLTFGAVGGAAAGKADETGLLSLSPTRAAGSHLEVGRDEDHVERHLLSGWAATESLRSPGSAGFTGVDDALDGEHIDGAPPPPETRGDGGRSGTRYTSPNPRSRRSPSAIRSGPARAISPCGVTNLRGPMSSTFSSACRPTRQLSTTRDARRACHTSFLCVGGGRVPSRTSIRVPHAGSMILGSSECALGGDRALRTRSAAQRLVEVTMTLRPPCHHPPHLVAGPMRTPRYSRLNPMARSDGAGFGAHKTSVMPAQHAPVRSTYPHSPLLTASSVHQSYPICVRSCRDSTRPTRPARPSPASKAMPMWSSGACSRMQDGRSLRSFCASSSSLIPCAIPPPPRCASPSSPAHAAAGKRLR